MTLNAASELQFSSPAGEANYRAARRRYPAQAIVDLATQELHPLAKRAKDIAAASVYVLSITAAIVGILVFAHAFGLVGSWH